MQAGTRFLTPGHLYQFLFSYDVLNLFCRSKGSQFEAIWVKYEDDPNLETLQQLSTERDLTRVLIYAFPSAEQ